MILDLVGVQVLNSQNIAVVDVPLSYEGQYPSATQSLRYEFPNLFLVRGLRYFPDEYSRLLIHEVIHMFEEHLAPNMDTQPRWWSEGLATYLSDQWRYEDTYAFRQPVLQGLETGGIPNIREIEASVELCYDWGWSIVMFIEKIYGRQLILRIVRECDNGDVCRMLGEDMRTFQRNWRRWLLRNEL